MDINLSIIWFANIVFTTLMYIVMDGFDLGIGILFLLIRDRDAMVNSVAPCGTATKPGWGRAAKHYLARFPSPAS